MFEGEKPITFPDTEKGWEEARRKLRELPKDKPETNYSLNPDMLEWDPYDDPTEPYTVSTMFDERSWGVLSKENAVFLDKKEKEWQTEISEAEKVISYFRVNQSSPEQEGTLKENCIREPEYFFHSENLQKLEGIPQEERIFMLAKASRHISNTPKQFREYVALFPEDMQKIKALFLDDYMPKEGDLGKKDESPEWNEENKNALYKNYYHPDETMVTFELKEESDEELKRYLFSLAATEMDNLNPELKDLFLSFNSFLRTAQKRNFAKSKLLQKPLETISMPDEESGKVFEDFKKIVADNNFLDNYYLKREDILGEKYENLSAKQKTELLRKCLAYVQYSIVFRETFNFHYITQDSIKQENISDEKNKYGSASNFNPERHSVIYTTKYKPFVFKEETEEKNKEYIERSFSTNPSYATIKVLLSEMKKLGEKDEEKEKNTKIVVDLWNKNRTPLLLHDICETLSSQNPSLAASELIKVIKQEKQDKSPLLAALYRLELGTMGISEKGMDYIGEKCFDLGEYNDPKFSALRITNNGAIGIFQDNEGEKELLKYFYLEGLEEEEKEIKAKIMDITLDTLCMAKSGNTEEDAIEKNKYLKELKKNYYKIANDKIFEETGARLNNLSFREQGSFIIYFNKADDTEKTELREFVKRYGEDGIKAFLATEKEKGMGKKILIIGEKTDPKIAGAVFEKYAEIISNMEKDKKEIADMFAPAKNISLEEMQRINDNLLERADKLILNFSDQIEKSGEEGNLKMEILSKLSRINSENVLFSSIFKTAYESGEINDFSEIGKLDLEIKKSAELSEEDRKGIIEIVNKNYENDQTRLSKILEGIEKSFLEPYNRWYILKKSEEDKKKIISTMQFKPQRNGDFYAASFNVDEEFQNSAIGKAMNEKVLDSINENETTVAISKVGDPCSIIHVNHTRWVITGIEHDEKTGNFYYKIMRNKQTRDAQREEIPDQKLLELFRNKSSSQEEPAGKEDDSFIMELTIDNPDDLKKITKANERGYQVVRLIPDKENSRKIYHLFEKTNN